MNLRYQILKFLKKRIKEKKNQYCQTLRYGQNSYTLTTGVNTINSKAYKKSQISYYNYCKKKYYAKNCLTNQTIVLENKLLFKLFYFWVPTIGLTPMDKSQNFSNLATNLTLILKIIRLSKVPALGAIKADNNKIIKDSSGLELILFSNNWPD